MGLARFPQIVEQMPTAMPLLTEDLPPLQQSLQQLDSDPLKNRNQIKTK